MVAQGERRNPGVPDSHDRLPIRLGITTPVLTLLPGWYAPWEVDGNIEDVALVARTAESLGYFHLTCSEHVVIPTEVAASRGSRYWDPLATFGYLAAVTSRIRLATSVLVLGYHHPLEIAKRYGTLDQVASGRLILGLGVGSLQEEFDLLGVDFAGRGRVPTMRCRRCGFLFRRTGHVTTAPSTATRTWCWTPARSSHRFPSGSAGGPPDPSGVRSSSRTGGCPSPSGPTTWPA